jgi:DNA polymerase
MITPPPELEDRPNGTVLRAGMGTTSIIADFDFETYSPAGFVWNGFKFKPPHGAKTKGLPVVGTAVYSEHPEAEVLCLAYDLKDGVGSRQWRPGKVNPIDLFFYIFEGGLLEAWNVTFERWIWENICVPKYGFPHLPVKQLRCAAAKARAHALPGSLDPCGEVLNIQNKKLKDGKRLIEKFCCPRNPTKLDARKRTFVFHDPEDANQLYNYNLVDIKAEAELSSQIPDLSPDELRFWQADQEINWRGVQVDVKSVEAGIEILEQAHRKYNKEIEELTNGAVKSASEVAKIRVWMLTQGVTTDVLDKERVTELLKQELPVSVKRVLQIRELIGSAAVKKLYAMKNTVTKAGRIHNLFLYHSARTGRAAGVGVQPQNMPNSGPSVIMCAKCSKHYSGLLEKECPWCGYDFFKSFSEWNPQAAQDAISVIQTGSLPMLEYYFGDAMATLSGCLRGMFISAPGKDLICSDYSAIEAVVLAALSGEEWRMEVFRTHGMIYETSASSITGIPLEEFNNHRKQTGQHHPARKSVGKVAELALGYAGWINAWRQFDNSDKTDEEIKQTILAWRRASPAIVEFWGGQQRNWQPELYGLEGMAVLAIQNPGQKFSYGAISFVVTRNVLYMRLPSGRYLTYHKPELRPSDKRQGTYQISYEGMNTNVKYGKSGWYRLDTYSGRIAENCVQAVARDILAHAIVALENAGYPVVLHVHDEIVVEVPECWGSVEDVERIMSKMPEWAKDWPVKATGGWRAKRYSK